MAEEVASTADFAYIVNAKLNGVEEKTDMLREKILALDETFFAQEEKFNKEINLIKEDIKQIKEELLSVSEGLQGILREITNLSRKEEVRAIERMVKMWEPLKFVKADELKEMIEEALEKNKPEEKNIQHTHIG